MPDICGDNRFKIIAEAKEDLLEATNIGTSNEEMAVLDSFLFRCWQMGWLSKYDVYEFCDSCKEYDQEQHCCHRWTQNIRRTVEELKAQYEHPAKVENVHEEYDVEGICFLTYADCGNCGAQVCLGDKFCSECGAKLDWGEE